MEVVHFEPTEPLDPKSTKRLLGAAALVVRSTGQAFVPVFQTAKSPTVTAMMSRRLTYPYLMGLNSIFRIEHLEVVANYFHSR